MLVVLGQDTDMSNPSNKPEPNQIQSSSLFLSLPLSASFEKSAARRERKKKKSPLFLGPNLSPLTYPNQFLSNRHYLSPPPNPHSRYCVRSNLTSSKFRVSPPPPPPPPHITPPTLLPSSSSIASSIARNGFVCWYLRMIEARPVLTKSPTAGAIFTAADVSSQVVRIIALHGGEPVLSNPSSNCLFDSSNNNTAEDDNGDGAARVKAGKTNILIKLAERMAVGVFAGVTGSAAYDWVVVSGIRVCDVQLVSEKTTHQPGRLAGLVLNASTTFWVPVCTEKVYDTLRDETSYGKDRDMNMLMNSGES